MQGSLHEVLLGMIYYRSELVVVQSAIPFFDKGQIKTFWVCCFEKEDEIR
jgi:hypothetical protein